MGSSLYPLEGEDEAGTRFTVTLPKEQHDDLDLVAKVWNELDATLGIERKKWNLNRVLGRFVSVGLDKFWQEAGGRPTRAEDREAFIRAAVDHIRQKAKK